MDRIREIARDVVKKTGDRDLAVTEYWSRLDADADLREALARPLLDRAIRDAVDDAWRAKRNTLRLSHEVCRPGQVTRPSQRCIQGLGQSLVAMVPAKELEKAGLDETLFAWPMPTGPLAFCTKEDLEYYGWTQMASGRTEWTRGRWAILIAELLKRPNERVKDSLVLADLERTKARAEKEARGRFGGDEGATEPVIPTEPMPSVSAESLPA